PRYRADSTRQVGYWDRLTTALATLPGVKAAGVSNWVPLAFAGIGNVDVEDGRAPRDGVGYRAVSEGYLVALGVPLLTGRGFGPDDTPTSERVVVINQRAAALCWPGQIAVGKRIRATSFESIPHAPTPAWLRVVGVVGNLRQWGPDLEPVPEMYVLFRQVPYYASAMTVVVRPAGPAEPMMAAVRAAARRVDPTVAVEVGTLERELVGRLAPRRLTMSLLAGFGGFAVSLTAIGLYGLLSYSVSRRQRELALRSALGANRAHLVRIVAERGLGLVLAGAVIGLGAAAALTRFMETLLVDVAPIDPVAFGASLTVLLGVAALAILIPAIRSTRVDPATALQGE
ncbi:MAG: FtsX-like permease family protein, partial [Gemmatimonadota bacterium]